MPNEFQMMMDSRLKIIPITNCYIDDILIASKVYLVNKNLKYLGQQEHESKM